MTSFISQLHNDLRTALVTKRGRQNIDPDSVPKGVCKEYVRMSKRILPQPLDLSMSVSEALFKRSSHTLVSDCESLTDLQWGTLLGTALGKIESSNFVRRRYPSGGALYPIETYVVTTFFNEKKQVVFHYNPTLHALEKLWSLPESINLRSLVAVDPNINFSSVIIFTSVWRRSSAKYGDFTYNLALMEAGHMAQNIQIVATAMNLPCRPIAGFMDENINAMLDIDVEEEQVVYTIIL